MTAAPPAGPSPRALGESLAALAIQVADLRGEVRALNERLDQAGLDADLNLAGRFEDLAQTVADALEAAAPCWIGLDRDTYHARLAEVRQWADTVLRQHYGGYELRDCWSRHIHAVLGTVHPGCRMAPHLRQDRPRSGPSPGVLRPVLPGTMRRIADVTRTCMPHCVTLRGPDDWTARPGYRLYLRRA